MADYPFVAGDTLPNIVGQFTQGDPAVVLPLTGATVGVILMTAAEVLVTPGGILSVTDVANGIVTYAPVAGDFATPGDYFLRFTATFGGKRLSSPNSRWLWLVAS